MLTFNPFMTSKVWEFEDPDTGYKFKSETKEKLIQHIVNYRAQNQLVPIENLHLVLDHYLCSLPVNMGACKNVDPIRRGVLETVKGGVTIFKTLLYSKFASQELAESRAKVCETCPENVLHKSNAFIRWGDRLAKAMIGDKKVSTADKLGHCRVCSCAMKSKVFIHTDLLDFTEEEITAFPDFCWQKKEYLSKAK